MQLKLLYPEIVNSGENKDVKFGRSLRFLAVIMIDESGIDTMFCQLQCKNTYHGNQKRNVVKEVDWTVSHE